VTEEVPLANPQPDAGASRGDGAWVILPTYNEADNVAAIAAAILEALPGAILLIVDDASPDGTGRLADELSAQQPQVRVLHRPAKEGLGRAYVDGFRMALGEQARVIVQMDADWSHDPTDLPRLIEPIVGDSAELVLGSRYVAGGGVVDWGIGRRAISRGGSVFARIVLQLPAHDLTGGFKAWRADTLAGLVSRPVRAGGYVFQIEMTHRAVVAGARLVEIPIVFRDRRVGQSKMSRRIVVEALLVVVQLRLEGWSRAIGRRVKGSRR